jgi:hypothetical protein
MLHSADNGKGLYKQLETTQPERVVPAVVLVS